MSSADESELLDKMPMVMRTAIAVDINMATFQKIVLFQVSNHRVLLAARPWSGLFSEHSPVPSYCLFQGCDHQMLVDMLLRLKSIVYLPGDFVVKKVSICVSDG